MSADTGTKKAPTSIKEAAQPALSFEWGAIKWLFNQEIDPEAQQTFGLVFINSGQQNPPHYHPNCEELIYVLSGECDHRLDDAVIHLEPGSLLRIPAHAAHCATNTGWEPVRMIIVYSAADRQTVFLE
jgi:quercetin dioxygenase-like cupin family protein